MIAAPFMVLRSCILSNENYVFSASQLVVGILLALAAFVLVFFISDSTRKKKDELPRPAGRQLKNMVRFIYLFVVHFPLALRYIRLLKKYEKDTTTPFDEKYKASVKMLDNINRCGRISLQVYGRENLVRDKSVLLVSNHQGKYDGIAIFSALYDYPCSMIVDEKMVNLPLYGNFSRVLGAKLIDKRDPKKSIQAVNEMAKSIAGGRSHLLFPEGDWGDNKNTLQTFYTGGFNAAFRAKCDITPIVLYDSYKVFSIPSLKRIYPEIHILPPIRYEEFSSMRKNELADLVKDVMQKELDRIEYERASAAGCPDSDELLSHQEE